MKLLLSFIFISALAFGQKFVGVNRPSSFSAIDTAKYGIQTDKIVYLNTKSKPYSLDTIASKVYLDSLVLFFINQPSAIIEIEVKTFGQQKAQETMTLSAARTQSLVDFLIKNRHVQAGRLRAAGPKCPPPLLPQNIAHLKFIEPKNGIWTKITVLSHDHVPK